MSLYEHGRRVAIVAGVRTPFARAGTLLRRFTAIELGGLTAGGIPSEVRSRRLGGVGEPVVRFDLVFDNFNAAASYSSPAAIRLLQGACGQSPHAKLYDRPDPGCQLMHQLERAGFAPQWQMNHDGAFGGFALRAWRTGACRVGRGDP